MSMQGAAGAPSPASAAAVGAPTAASPGAGGVSFGAGPAAGSPSLFSGVAVATAGAPAAAATPTVEEATTELYDAVQKGNEELIKTCIANGANTQQSWRFCSKFGCKTPLDLATDGTCREIIEHHAAILATILKDPTALVAASLAHCASLSASEERLPATALSLRAHHFGPAFLWAPPAARSAVFAWARVVFIAQHAGSTQPFERLPDDCAGDVLEFFGMTHNESELIAKHCSSPEAQDWVRAVIAAAVAAKATADLVPAAKRGDVATVQGCLSKKANIETKDENGWTALFYASQEGHTATVQLLLGAGADKEAKDKLYGNTALFYASMRGYTATVQLLLGAGADKEAKNKRGNTALFYASLRGYTATMQLLEGWG